MSTYSNYSELRAAEAQATLNRLLADVARVKVCDVRAAFDAYHQGLTDMSQERIDRLLADAEHEVKPEAITTELECTGIDQYAIEIEQAGRRIRYEAPSVEGVRDLMRMNREHKWWVESANAQAEFEQAQIDRAVEKFEAKQSDDVAEKQRAG